ncbi:MAG: SGNH/GDSL hydrolase family protein [Crocinitomicaceae bacterium]
MRKILIFLDLVFILFVGWQLFSVKKQTKVLFIGNSYTYRNEMPDIFEHISISMGKKVYVQSCTQGKATLLIQSRRSAVYRAIREQNWDYVIIQGSSRDFIRDEEHIEEITIPALEKLLKAIKKNYRRSKTLFYMTWGYRNGFKPKEETNTYEKMTHKIRDGYLDLMERYRFGVVPVGMAWKDSRSKRADVILHVKDGAHPSLKGSYLAACCFYSAIFNESAIGSTYYSKLGPRTCYYLQSVGSKNVLYQRKKYGLIPKV